MPRALTALAWALSPVSLLGAGLAVERHDPPLLTVSMGSSLAAVVVLARGAGGAVMGGIARGPEGRACGAR